MAVERCDFPYWDIQPGTSCELQPPGRDLAGAAAIRQVPPRVPRFARVAFTRGMLGWYDSLRHVCPSLSWVMTLPTRIGVRPACTPTCGSI